MEKKLSEDICNKDNQKAQQAANELINNINLNEFEALCEKMDYLFDFVRENVYKRLSLAIIKNNFRNVIKFFDFYSPYFDDFFASILAKYANEDLTDEIYDLLSSGNQSQKAYAACYFKFIPDTVAIDELRENLNSKFDPLFENCAAALGKMSDTESFSNYLPLLKSEDDFIKLKAVRFFSAFGDKKVVEDLIDAMEKSVMAENIAGEIINLVSPIEILKSDYDKAISLINNLINGLGEILPLENIFNYEIYEITDFLVNNCENPKAALILLNLKNKLDILTQNEEYVFDLDKETKNEIYDIKKLLFSKNEDFWNREKSLLLPLMTVNCPLFYTVLNVIKDNQLKEFLPKLISLINTDNETIKFEIISAVKELGGIKKIKKNDIIFSNQNLKAAFEQMFFS